MGKMFKNNLVSQNSHRMEYENWKGFHNERGFSLGISNCVGFFYWFVSYQPKRIKNRLILHYENKKAAVNIFLFCIKDTFYLIMQHYHFCITHWRTYIVCQLQQMGIKTFANPNFLLWFKKTRQFQTFAKKVLSNTKWIIIMSLKF